jgi:hypothetical protein
MIVTDAPQLLGGARARFGTGRNANTLPAALGWTNMCPRRPLLRSLIERVVVHPGDDGPEIELCGEIVKMIELGLDAEHPWRGPSHTDGRS